jgi:hypothetical protein
MRLVCPLCGAVVADGAEPASGACPSCGAAVAGGGESPQEGVHLALERWALADLPAEALAQRLFETEPAAAPAPAAAITSDERAGFYRWWVFVREGGGSRRTVLEDLLAG